MSEDGSGERPAWTESVPEPVRTAIEGVQVDVGPAPAEAMTLDDYYGYTFTARDETPGEYLARSESAGPPQGTGLAVSPAALVPSGTYRLRASFAEHDHRFGGDATSDVDSDVPLTRDEAQRLAEDAIDVEARQRMTSMYPHGGAEMEPRPSLSALWVTRLLEVAPAVGPQTADTLDAFRERAARIASAVRDVTRYIVQ